jgi:dipeptidyl aminopeptidase/acylaminoacyl peptidase
MKIARLFVQGDDDRNVFVNQTIDLIRLMREKNVPFELLIIPDDVHDFLRYENWIHVYKASADFFDRKLK